MSNSNGLLVLAAIAMGFATLLLLNVSGEAGLDIDGYFNELVDECQSEHPDWDRSVCEGIVRSEVWVGMTSDMLLASLGEPRAVDKPRADHPEYEEWTYRTFQYGEERMMLLEGILVDYDQEEPCSSCGDAKPGRP